MATPETLALFEQQRLARAAMITAGVLASEVYVKTIPEQRTNQIEDDPIFRQATENFVLAAAALDSRDYKVNN